MKQKQSLLLIFLAACLSTFSTSATDNKDTQKNTSSLYNGLTFRSIGPALMSGRISDIVIHPHNENTWYVTAGSGGVWKTENTGTTWNPIFDNEKSYSIGCITLDPQNPSVLWVGTGENVGGRHVGYGDGIYMSKDGGKSWNNKGLQKSEHISKIIVHPTNSQILWVAAQGPLWSKGGQRGIFKSIDGGETWHQTLGDNEWVGATDLLIDPRNSNVLYAATWQRHRTVAAYMGGGPGTALYKSNDGGETWEKLTKGLPSSNMGKIGLGIAPQNPDIIYAAIELDRRTGGVYRSTDKGASWQKMSDAVSGGTGPHYYQELYVSPHHFDEIYLADNYMQVSYDGGKTFSRMNEEEKHVDNHAVAFKKDDPNYLLVGCDGGLYETFDKTKNWKFIDNLPLTQFYKIAVDDSDPFYNVYGGTQDNNTQGAPSRTDNLHGIRNSDWFVVLGGDGHQPATEPGNPNIVYAQWQRGNLNRHDRLTGENIDIKPQAALGEKTERFNWDAPILVSPHQPKRLYFASQRVWKSDDRGDSWTPISSDLTNNIERISSPFFGQQQKWDNPWDIYAMSNYSTITSLSESPVKEGLIYAGTDDGIIQVTQDGGENWRKVDFRKIQGLPNTAFVNDIKADLYDENIVYALFDNHKYGDYKPYIFKSHDKGKTWTSLAHNLTEKTLLWRIVQDHEDPKLFFLGTEFGVYFSNDGAKSWIPLKSGMPTISVRDLAIQKRENDLVVGTFGRGIYILDDFSSLRNFQASTYEKEAKLFNPRDGYWYQQKRVLGGSKKASQGDNYFLADNPPFGVEFTYFLKDAYISKKAQRQKEEQEAEKDKQAVSVPAWQVLEEEARSLEPNVCLFIYAEDGRVVRKIKATNSKGYQRLHWDLKTASDYALTKSNYQKEASGIMVAPGQYSAQLFKQIEGLYSPISEQIAFAVNPLMDGALMASSPDSVAAYWQDLHAFRSTVYSLSNDVRALHQKVDLMLTAYERAHSIDPVLQTKLLTLRKEALILEHQMNGSDSRSEVGAQNEYPTIWTYLWSASGASRSSYGPTKTHLSSFQIARQLFTKLEQDYKDLNSSLEPLKDLMNQIGAPTIKK